MVKVIAEIGINHESSEVIAKRLIDAAHNSGCWAIKFQYRSPKGFYSTAKEIGDELIEEQLSKNYLSLSTIRKLHKYAKKKNLEVGISFFTEEDFEKIITSNIQFDFYKIPSAEFSNTDLVQKVKSTGNLLILSTGGHNLKEIKNKVKQYNFTSNTVILHCTSNYPSELGSQNLNTITELNKIQNVEIGYSSHDIDYEVVFLAASLGAKYIERHITLDKYGKGLDDSSSSEYEDFVRINKILNNIDNILGESGKPVNQGEIINLQNLGTSLYSKNNITKNTIISLVDFDIKAPRKGLTKDEIKPYLNKPILKDLKPNEPITKSHFVKNYVLNTKDYEFMNFNNLSIPIRFHDMDYIFNEFKIKNFEFHMSYKDVQNLSLNSLSKKKSIFENKVFSYHLPDYINSYELFDPLSKNRKVLNESNKILNSIIEFKNLASEKDSSPAVFVSSLSQNVFKEKKEFYEKLKIFIDDIYEKFNVLFLPQWLPKQAWYFGGAYDINLFSTLEDIEFIRKYKINICLDVAHLIMSANSANTNWEEWFNLLTPFTKHYHLSDSYGTDGEGVEFGKGELGNPKQIISLKEVKVLEVWQGHLNEFEGFKSAVRSLRNYYK